MSEGIIVEKEAYDVVFSGDKSLMVETTIGYDTPASHVRECTKHHYDRVFNEFFSLGPICGK